MSKAWMLRHRGAIKTEMGAASMTEPSTMISAIVLTHNEENNIRWCLESVVDVMPIYVVDSGSTDDTLAICNQYTKSIGHHAYHNHATQWTWALASTPFRSRWILVLDADFVVSAALRARIEHELAGVADEVAGIYVRHCYKFAGGMIRYGGTKRYWLRLVRRGRARPDQGDLVDFRFVVEGRTVKWRQSVLEYNRKDDDSTVWLKKQDKFALRLAVEEELRRRRLHKWDGKPRLFGNADERFAWLRDRWLDVPLFVRPFLYFLYRYVVAGGFLDGRAGAIYHIFQGLWLRLLVDWKTVELRWLEVDDVVLEQIAGAMLTIQSGSVAEARRAIAGPRPDRTTARAGEPPRPPAEVERSRAERRRLGRPDR